MTRLLYGNLDAELGWGPPDLRELPAPVRAMISAAATTMCGFARAGDRLWIPGHVEPERLPALPNLDRPTLIEGTPPDDATAVLPWGATEAYDALTTHTVDDVAAPEDEPTWISELWATRTDPAIAARVNHRVYSADLSQSRGVALPGTAVVDDLAALEAHLADGGAEAGHEQWWVIKAPHSASGRLRLRQQGPQIEDTARVRAQRLFDRYGPLVFEPWMDRVADIGCVGMVTDDGHWTFAPHLLDCDAAGVWRGLKVDDEHAVANLTDAQRDQLDDTVSAVGAALKRDGYRGPFGIDAYLYRGDEDDVCLNPLSEINARVSFGHVGRALLDRCADGSGIMRLASRPVPAGDGIIPLILPSERDATSAWLEV